MSVTPTSEAANRAFERGLRLLRDGAFFAAHEELEVAWRAAPAAERDFLQGLVHVAVAWYQAGRGRTIGCERQLAKAERRLRPYAPSHRGVEVDQLLTSVTAAAEVVGGGSLELPPPAI
jgi:predicted metal-dependent hydrolase